MERPERVTDKCGALDLPDWLPQSVGDLAKVKSADLLRQSADSEIWRLLRRLVSDPRMWNVWNELQRRRRQSYQRTEIFIHPASTTKSWTTRGEWMWEHAEKLRQRGGFRNKSEANRLEACAAMAELGEVDRIFPFY